VKVTLEQVTKAQKGSRGTPLLFLQLRRWIWWVVNAMSRLLSSRGRDLVVIVQGAGWATEKVFLFNLQHSGDYVYHAV